MPKQYVPGTAAPFIVGADGPDRLLFTVLDNLIAEHKVPVMIAISIGNGSGDAQGSERGLEYDTMSGRYAEFVESEVLPMVEAQAHVKLTHNPEARATMGGSSGGSCALIMAWYHPELYHRVLTYSGTYVNQQWPSNPQTPGGAWEFHEHLHPQQVLRKPIRMWMEVGDKDLSQLPMRCETTCTTGSWPMSRWPRCWPPRAITISLSLPATQATLNAPPRSANAARGIGVSLAGLSPGQSGELPQQASKNNARIPATRQDRGIRTFNLAQTGRSYSAVVVLAGIGFVVRS